VPFHTFVSIRVRGISHAPHLLVHRLPTASCVVICFALDVELIARLTIRYTSSRMQGAMTSQSLPSVPSAAYSSASTTVRNSFNTVPTGRYDPYAPPRLPPPPTTSAGSSAVSKPGKINEHCLNSVSPTHCRHALQGLPVLSCRSGCVWHCRVSW